MAADVNSFLPITERTNSEIVEGSLSILATGFTMKVDSGAAGKSSFTADDYTQGNDGDYDYDSNHDGCTSHAHDAEPIPDSKEGVESKSLGLPFPGFAAKIFLGLDQTTPPRSWCLQLIMWPYPFTLYIIRIIGASVGK